MFFKQINLRIEIPFLSLCCCGELKEFDSETAARSNAETFGRFS